MFITLWIITAWFLADILAGIVHWWEDKYLDGKSRFSFINRISADNDLHHEDPHFLSQLSLWQNINTTVYVTGPLCIILILIGAPMICWLTVLFGSFANVIHSYGHVVEWAVPLPIRWLQKSGVFISQVHHRQHHYDNYWYLIDKQDTTIRWCPMTNWMNPILDYIKFFKFLEFSFRLVGIRTTKQRRKK